MNDDDGELSAGSCCGLICLVSAVILSALYTVPAIFRWLMQ